MKHTPGPWILDASKGDSNSYRIDVGGMCVRVYGRYRYLPNGETVVVKRTLANACLIASAPDLLDACRKLAAAYDHARSPDHGDALLRMARDAIANAEGQPTT